MGFVTADQLVAHAIGDYLLQSDWMATEKRRASVAAAVHALCYSLPFLFLSPSLAAWAFIVGTHFVIDRWRLARYVVWAKNWIAPRYLEIKNGPPSLWYRARNLPWQQCEANGFAPGRPEYLTTWLLIVVDNVCHVLCNAAALKWF